MTYVFRNNTIEQFLGTGYTYSAYDDITTPQAEEYIWWYQVPLRFDTQRLVEEVRSYVQKLCFVIGQIGNKPIYVFTLDATGIRTIESSATNIFEAIDECNAAIYAAAKKQNVKVVHISEFLSQYAVNDLFDDRYYLTAQIPYNPQLINSFRKWWKRRKEEVTLMRKKCIILDLDNTLWGGVLGEDGIESIKLSGSYPGKAFHLWQEGLKELKKSGVMLAICSKNNLSDVEEVWDKRDDMVLHKEDFVAMRINWQDKVSNIRDLVIELNIGLDSVVFIDDNPTEREWVRQQLPEVVVPDYNGQPYELIKLYHTIVENYFGTYNVTQEDRVKTMQYLANSQRKQLQASFMDMEEYLQSLEIKLRIERINDTTIQRVTQLTQKTNQFNLTTHRYTEAEIRQMITYGADMWTLTVSDKFGDYGLTGVMIIVNGIIDTFLVSCRILGKKIEDAFAKSVLKQYTGKMRAVYVPTSKNMQVADFYDKLGFVIENETAEEKIYYCEVGNLDLSIASYLEIEFK